MWHFAALFSLFSGKCRRFHSNLIRMLMFAEWIYSYMNTQMYPSTMAPHCTIITLFGKLWPCKFKQKAKTDTKQCDGSIFMFVSFENPFYQKCVNLFQLHVSSFVAFWDVVVTKLRFWLFEKAVIQEKFPGLDYQCELWN